MANGGINKFTDKIFPAIAPGNQTANNNLKTLPPLPANKSQVNTALNHITGQVAARRNSASQTAAVKGAGDGDTPKTATDFLREIRSRQPFDAAALAKKKTSVELKLSKPSEKSSVADYDAAAWKAIFKEAGYSMLSDKEIGIAVQAMKNIGWTAADNGFTLSNLRKADAQPGPMFLKTDRALIEKAKLAGQAVLQFQEYKAKRLDAAIEKGRNYATEAVGGFVQPIVNAPVNIVNGISEPFRAAERLSFGTKYIPEIPRMQVAERSEYWNKDGRMVINRGAEIGATMVFGGAAGSKAIGTQAGRIFLGIESGYNIGAGIAGKDVAQTDEQGNARQMEWTERGLRVAGGLFGARQTIKTEIATPNSITNRAVDKLDDIFKNNSTFKPQGELVTPEGIRVRVPQQKTSVEKMGEPLEISISSDKANAPHVKKGNNPPYGGTRAQEIILKEDTVFVRVHGTDNQGGRWLMRQKDIEGLTARQIKDKFALPELPTYISDVYVPAGTKITVGKVAPVKGWGNGGGIQYEMMMKNRLPGEAFKNMRKLR